MGRIIPALTISIPMLLFSSTGLYAGRADDYWPMWRGPLASGVSPTGNPP